VHARAAVDHQRLPGDEVALGGGEEDDRPDEVLRRLRSLQRAVLGCGEGEEGGGQA